MCGLEFYSVPFSSREKTKITKASQGLEDGPDTKRTKLDSSETTMVKKVCVVACVCVGVDRGPSSAVMVQACLLGGHSVPPIVVKRERDLCCHMRYLKRIFSVGFPSTLSQTWSTLQAKEDVPVGHLLAPLDQAFSAKAIIIFVQKKGVCLKTSS